MAKDFNSSSYSGCLLKTQTDLRTLVAPSCEIVLEAGIGLIIIRALRCRNGKSVRNITVTDH
jgi:proline racemase